MSQSDWATGPEALEILGVHDIRTVNRLVAEGLVGFRRLPVRARFRRSDLEQLARLSLVEPTRSESDPALSH